MKLPSGANAVVELIKLREYCLSPTHPRGRHKARVFQSALSMTADDAEFLRIELLRAAAEEDNVQQGKTDEFGTRFFLDFDLNFLGRTAVIRSAWIVPCDDSAPQLISCYVLLD